ncbi:SP_0009 family protein [Streptococcus oriscaviae]|nr:SP_0009 family protein [Streptococcus oriscaviae]
MTEDILKTVETFLRYSDEKLEELSKKNRELKLEEPTGKEGA